ncbi:uncharacterized protein LOC115420399 [Sphaeramia orbicularis]|uniref:uncharacterized protein LOC115420399 n=1 Tax=Sphaeramia orbicularis TaxID=375764 RepID=UPI00117D7308|nr:uncharacterized protein LOC115420399 [Sphaeramia orbicularis]
MEEDLETFLKARGVSAESINVMKQDKKLPVQPPASKRSRRFSPLPDSSEVPTENRALSDEEDTLVLMHTDVAVPNTSSHGQPLLSNEALHEIMETNVQPINSEIFPSDEPGSANPEVHYIWVHRVTIIKDLVRYFLDPNITKYTLKMEFLNENASDDSGVSRDVYSEFWEKFLEQCEGEEERVPRLKPDTTKEEWKAVGRIWAKGFIDHGMLPVRLSKSFKLSSIHGIDTVDVNVLMSSFLNYVSYNERKTIERALEGKLEESDEEDLLDLLSRMGSQCLPHKENLVSTIQTMAHKAILQQPKYIIDCFSEALSYVQLNLLDKTSVLSVYEMKRATGKKVAQLLQTSNEILSQQEQRTFNHIQRYVRSADQKKVEQFLRFCIGSSSMCVDKITVGFNAENGLNRRPVSHTCAATLELSYMYSSYPEFRTELDNIQSSNYLTMDIM